MTGGLGSLRNWLGLLIAVVLVTGALTVSEVAVDASSNGAQKEMTRDQVLTVTLESNPSTGYRWQVIDVDPNVLRQIGDAEFQAADSNRGAQPGAGGTETLRFAAVNSGTTNLMLVYWRPWEKGVQPQKIFNLQVTVR